MSIQIMNAVWQHFKSSGRARLVLLAIADYQGEIVAWLQDDEGGISESFSTSFSR